MSAKLKEPIRAKVRAYWSSDVTLTYQQVADRFACSPRQVRTAVQDLPREGQRINHTLHASRGAAIRDGLAPPGAIRVLKAIAEYRAAKGFSPTLRELCATLSITSTFAMRDHFDRLKKYGLITWEHMKTRTVQLTAKGEAALRPDPKAITPGHHGGWCPLGGCEGCAP